MGTAVVDTGRERVFGYDIARVLLGLLLLAAAGLKCYQLATEPVPEKGWMDSRWFRIAVVEFELLFGMWLLAGTHPRATWAAATLCFAGFAGVSLLKAVSGEASCGCFGRVQVNPWYTVGLDVAAVLALVWSRPSAWGKELEAPLAWSPRLTLVAVLFPLVGIPARVAMANYRPDELTDTGAIVGDSNLVVLEPESWTGMRFPLMEHIDIGGTLSRGRWIVLLFHHDCPDCQDAIHRYAQFFRQAEGSTHSPQITLVEVPPFAGAANGAVTHEDVWTYGRHDGTAVAEPASPEQGKVVVRYKRFLARTLRPAAPAGNFAVAARARKPKGPSRRRLKPRFGTPFDFPTTVFIQANTEKPPCLQNETNHPPRAPRDGSSSRSRQSWPGPQSPPACRWPAGPTPRATAH